MKKISVLLKLCYKFSKRYMQGYLSAIAKPVLFGILGVLLLSSCVFNVKFIICGFLSIPVFCWAFWRGYVITYGLIPCAHTYIKDTPSSFETHAKEAKKEEVNLAKYVCFSALLTVICYIPCLIYLKNSIPLSLSALTDPVVSSQYLKIANKAFIINTILLSPFLNYFLCAYYYRKEKENYFKLFLNCYKHIDIIGLIIAVILTLFSFMGGMVYVIVAIFLNPFVYSINTFWYMARVNKQSLDS